MDLKSYTLEELTCHMKSALSVNGGAVSLSPLRVYSYMNNPRAKPTDHVLFELRHEGRLVAYRTLLPDLFFNKEAQPQRFAWLSGNFVLPEYRRQGLSTKLLQMAEAHWDGKLMYTNYAPASKAVYDHTGQFPILTRKSGKRFYLRAASQELLGKRLGGKELLRTGDHMVNRIREGKLQKFRAVDHSQCHIKRIPVIDQEVTQLINTALEQSLFQRDTEIFSWILDYPWVTEKEVPPLNYQFTYSADRFDNPLLKFTLPGNRGTGLLWLVIHNQKLSVPYLFTDNEELYPLMARTLIHTMITRGCAYTTIRNPALSECIKQHKKLFLSIWEMPQIYFSHKKIAGLVPRNLEIHDGDGDVAFTG